jgi:hypothetical protein
VIDATGLCSRFAVVRTDDSEPIEGALYRDRGKAHRRANGSHNPACFRVDEVVVMPAELARLLVNFYVANKRNSDVRHQR